MPEITEFAFFPFKPTPEQDESAVAALKALGPELRARPGLLGSWYGTPLEKEFSVEFVNVWDTPESYKHSLSSPLHSKTQSLTTPLLDKSNPQIVPYRHAIHLTKPFSTIASSSPIIQLTTFFLPAETNKSAFEEAFNKVLGPLYANPPEGFKGGVNGWGVDDLDVELEGKKVKIFAAASGWESLECRIAAHKEIAGRFEEVGLGGFTSFVEVHHTSFQKID